MTSHSSLSREYPSGGCYTGRSDHRLLCRYGGSQADAERTALAYGIIYIPSDFSDNIAKGKQTQVSIYRDMSGLLYYKSMLIATAVSLDMNKDIKIARKAVTRPNDRMKSPATR